MGGVPGRAQGGQELGRALGPGLGGDHVDGACGGIASILPQPARPGERRGVLRYSPAGAASPPGLELTRAAEG